ncbi:MAG: sulfur carrier protein ThiS [Acidobacteriota bacterium]
MSEAIVVRVNGEERRFPAGMTISALLGDLEVSTPRVAVERNREIVPKGSYESTRIEEGDDLEVVEFVGGG